MLQRVAREMDTIIEKNMTDDQFFRSLQVKSSWESQNHKRVEDVLTVTCTDNYDSDEDECTSMVSPESCVHFLKETSQEPCILTVKCPSSAAVVRILVVSEAKVIELYGMCQEYLGTVSTKFLCEVDEMTVYTANIKLEHPTPECSLKFAKTSRSSDMWLYGMQVIWERNARNVVDQGLKSFVTIDERLKECPLPISQRAERCKEFIKLYGSLTENQRFQSKSLDAVPLVAMACKQEIPSCISAFNNHAVQLRNFSSDVRKESVWPHKLMKDTQFLYSNIPETLPIPSDSPPPSNGVEVQNCSNCINAFSVLLTESLQSLENRIVRALDERFEKLLQLQERQVELILGRMFETKTLSEKSLKTVNTPIYQEDEDSLHETKLDQTPTDFALNCSEELFIKCPSSSNQNPQTDDKHPEKSMCSTVLNFKDRTFNKNSGSKYVVHDSPLALDQNSNSICPSVPGYSEQNENDVKAYELNRLDRPSMMSLLCSKVSNESKNISGPLHDSVIEKALMDMIKGFSTSTMNGKPESMLSNQSF